MRQAQETLAPNGVLAQNAIIDRAFNTVDLLIGEVTRSMVMSQEHIVASVGGLAVGHVIYEGGVGTGKTRMAKVLASCIGGEFGRVQGVNDLEPSDITGSYIYNQSNGKFEYFKGPIFADVLIVDEINRMPPKTQSGLLEPMEEGQVTTKRNETFALPPMGRMIATHNPNAILQGVHPLIEAQLDRFSVGIELPPHDAKSRKAVYALDKNGYETEQVVSIADISGLRQAVRKVSIHDSLEDAMNRLIDSVDQHPGIKSGISTLRSGRTLSRSLSLAAAFSALSQGRRNVDIEDIAFGARYSIPHRIQTNQEAREAKLTAYDIVEQIAASTL